MSDEASSAEQKAEGAPANIPKEAPKEDPSEVVKKGKREPAKQKTPLEYVNSIPERTLNGLRTALGKIRYHFSHVPSLKADPAYQILHQTSLKIFDAIRTKTEKSALYLTQEVPPIITQAYEVLKKFQADMNEDEKKAYSYGLKYMERVVKFMKRIQRETATKLSLKERKEKLLAAKEGAEEGNDGEEGQGEEEEEPSETKDEPTADEEEVVSDVPEEEEEANFGAQLGDPALPSLLRIGTDGTSDYINLKVGRLNNTGLRQGPYLVYKSDYLKSNYNVKSPEQIRAMQVAFGVSRISGEQAPIVGYVEQLCRFSGIDLVKKALSYRLRILEDSIVQLNSGGQRTAVSKHKAEWIRQTLDALNQAKKPCPVSTTATNKNTGPTNVGVRNTIGRGCGGTEDLNLMRDLVYVLILLKGNADPTVKKQLESIKLKTILNAARRGDIVEQRKGLSAALDLLLTFVQTKVELTEDQVQGFLKPIYKYLRPTYEVPEYVRLKEDIFVAIDELTAALKLAFDTQKDYQKLAIEHTRTKTELANVEAKLDACRETESSTGELFIEATRHLDLARLSVVTLTSEKENLRIQLAETLKKAENDLFNHFEELLRNNQALEAKEKQVEDAQTALDSMKSASVTEKEAAVKALSDLQLQHAEALANMAKEAKEAVDTATLLKEVQEGVIENLIKEVEGVLASEVATKAALERKLEDEKEKLSTFEDQQTTTKNEFEKTIASLNEKLSVLSGIKQWATGEIEEKVKEIEGLKEVVENLSTTTSSELQTQLQTIKELEGKYDAVQNELAAAKESRKAAEEEANAALASAKAEAEANRIEAEAAISVAQIDLAEAKKRAEEAEAAAKAARERSGESSASAQAAQAEVKAAKEAFAAAKAAKEEAEADKDKALADQARTTTELDEQLTTLRAELEAQKAALGVAQSSLNAAEQRATSAEAALGAKEAASDAAIKAGESSNLELLGRIAELQRQVANFETLQKTISEILADGSEDNSGDTAERIRALVQGMKGLKNSSEQNAAARLEEKAALETEKTALLTRVQELERSLETAASRHASTLADVQAQLGQKDIELAALKAQLESLVAENEVLREKASRVNAMEGELEDAKKQLQECEASVLSDAERIRSLQTELANLRGAKTQAEASSASLQEVSRREEALRKELQDIQSTQRNELAGRNSMIAAKQATIDSLQRDLEAAKTTIASHEAQQAVLQKQVTDAQMKASKNSIASAQLTTELDKAKRTASVVQPVLQLLGITSTDDIVPTLQRKLTTIKKLESQLSNQEQEMRTRLKNVLATLLVNPEQTEEIGNFIFRGEGSVKALKANAELCQFFTYLYSIINYQMYRIFLAFPKSQNLQKDIFYLLKKKHLGKAELNGVNSAALLGEISQLLSRIFTQFGKTTTLTSSITVDNLPELYKVFDPEKGLLSGYKDDPFIENPIFITKMRDEFGDFMSGVIKPVYGSGAKRFTVRKADLDKEVFHANTDALVPLTLLYIKMVQLVNELFTDKYKYLLEDCQILVGKSV